MPINFPGNPSVNDVFTFGGSTYRWNGFKWVTVTYEIEGGPTGPTGPVGPTGPEPNLSDVNQNIVPSSDDFFSLGSSDLRWKDIYVSGNSIHLGEAVLSATDKSLDVFFEGEPKTKVITSSDFEKAKKESIAYSIALG